MTRGEAVNWLINITADIGKSEHRDLWHYEQALSEIREMLESEPERKKGKWIERHHAYADEDKAIEEWQSCKCSICGRYDTRPYLYYFSEPRFCSWCGADMRGLNDEVN